MTARGLLVSLLLLTFCACLLPPSNFGLSFDLEHESDPQFYGEHEPGLANSAEEDSREGSLEEDPLDEELEGPADPAFVQLATSRKKARDANKVVSAVEEVMNDKEKVDAKMKEGQDEFFLAKQDVDSGNDGMLECVTFKPKRKWDSILSKYCRRFRKNKDRFAACQKLAKLVIKSFTEQCAQGSFFDCRRNVGFPIINPAFVHIKDTGDLYLHAKDEYFNYIQKLATNYDNWQPTAVLGDSCLHVTINGFSESQNSKFAKKLEKIKDVALRHDTQNANSRLQALRSVMLVSTTPRVDPLLVTLVLELLDTRRCSGGFFRRKKKSDRPKNHWKQLLVQTLVYWFTVNPTKCDEILSGEQAVPPDPWAVKCQVLQFSVKQQKAVEPLLSALAQRKTEELISGAENLPKTIEEAVASVDDLVTLNAKAAMDARSALIFLQKKRRASLAILDFFVRSKILRKLLSFVVKKIINNLMPEETKLVLIGRLSRALKSSALVDNPLILLDKATLDNLTAGQEATVLCLTNRPNIAKTAVQAFLSAAEGAAKKEEKKPLASAPASLVQVRTNPTDGQPFGAAPDPPENIYDIPYESADLETIGDALSPKAQEFLDVMNAHTTDIFRRSWDEADGHHSSVHKLRSLLGFPSQRSDLKKGLVALTWGIALTSLVLGIVGVAMFPLGHLFMYLGALGLAFGLGLVILIPLMSYGIMWQAEFNRIAFSGGRDLRKVPKKRKSKEKRPVYKVNDRFSQLFEEQARLEEEAQQNTAFELNEGSEETAN
ncbi:hypothetical protein BESB_038950 [Besnoitia besnoiti]|uniref:Transmembrane protein n=1 Tax=Besnoitia besnoiti TaxID=94643 RepID=A0A2A9MNI1_BESBE|nr:hypothetical protein BESB_038950 [Besnoitia besnoiti]PFH37437.1 hypothetical protein BESB_038950 [Besnoitia besnoiti]